MPDMPRPAPFHKRSRWWLTSLMAAAAALMAACKAPPEPQPSSSAQVPSTDTGAVETQRTSGATTAHAYRQDAATHLYGLNAQRVWKGKLPSMLYAIGVLEVDINRTGHVTRLHWMRAPKHAPEVIAEIERTVRAAAPFPAPVRLGKVTYTDTWLWDQSGHFQLDTLSEGQH